MTRTALITGISGQDGSYLAEFLLAKGYRVHGVIRRLSSPNLDRIAAIRDRITLHDADLLDQPSLLTALERSEPDEVYNLAAQSFVPISWSQPILTGEFTAMGVARLLEAIRKFGRDQIRFYQASSSEMFGRVRETPQRETTPFYPRSPYGVAKAFGHFLTVNYRESYGMFCTSGILFNHESPRRGTEFVTRKISLAAARIKLGLQEKLRLGNLDAERDWGFAGDYVDAMWRMLQQPEAKDYVIGTGTAHSVREFVNHAFARVGLDPDKYVEVDPEFIRPAEVDHLIADPTRAHQELGWKESVSFQQLVELMVDADLELSQREKFLAERSR